MTYRKLSKLAQDAKWAERGYIELGMLEQATRYHAIWCKLAGWMIDNIKRGGAY